ncbi:PREDICTED: phospholipase B1, membrane-associated-like [Ceratosolen solmsi marchali]|uniref:Phospholipase B1, membrane-associated n=1 Tax=Ceratosolen solmsi marchali TaxID=326594 RepID=A0AAJ6YVX6_9HYME|nr:PREDICTED: phospholipase B1, membrane-associated-like [Ceratosolen solmsi marchali]
MQIQGLYWFCLTFVFVLLWTNSVQATSFAQMILSFFQSGKNALDFEGAFYPRLEFATRRQQIVPPHVAFPCDLQYSRSAVPPTSVHRLRPGDIDVIGGLGDSLVAASGALEEYAIGTFIEARGVSWCVGGQDDWRKYLTIPNLLKEYNPRLTGYSTGTGEFISHKAKLNIAYPVAAAEDALYQARILVQRIRSNRAIDIHKHWKMITIFFGANDVCSAQCYNPTEFSPIRYMLHLRRTLDFLRIALPRTIINLIPAIDVTISLRLPMRSVMCSILHPLYCACMHRGSGADIAASKMSHMYQQAAEDLINSGRYDMSDDFTVVLQPFIKLFNAPNANPRFAPMIDANLVTYDCFHFSQKGHAHGANLLWNNMLEPVGNKTKQGLSHIFERFLCPSRHAPYIFTNINSRNFLRTGSQEGMSPVRSCAASEMRLLLQGYMEYSY